MLKNTVQFTDHDGNKVVRDCYFRISKVELTRLEAGESKLAEDGNITGGFFEKLQAIRKSGDGGAIVKAMEDFIFLSYGERDPEDPSVFHKSAELSKRFANSLAYEALFDKLLDPKNGELEKFINGILPPDLLAAAQKDQDKPAHRPEAPKVDSPPVDAKPIETNAPAPVENTAESRQPTQEEIEAFLAERARKDESGK